MIRTLLLGFLLALGVTLPGLALYGAEQAAADEAAYAATIHLRRGNTTSLCSGVVIHRQAVLSAAHCVRDSRGRARRVTSLRIGNPRGTTTRARARDVIVHPDYNPAMPEAGSDFALIVLREPLSVTPVGLPAADSQVETGSRVRIYGFGQRRQRGRAGTRLTAADLEVLSPFACFSGPVQEMARTRMCAASPQMGVCPGDSGSPAVLDGKVVGVVSVSIDAGPQCSRSAAVMGKVATFRSWIDQSLATIQAAPTETR